MGTARRRPTGNTQGERIAALEATYGALLTAINTGFGVQTKAVDELKKDVKERLDKIDKRLDEQAKHEHPAYATGISDMKRRDIFGIVAGVVAGVGTAIGAVLLAARSLGRG